MAGYFYEWRPYVSVAARRRQAARAVAALRKQGRTVDPVTIEGRKIARTFWGKAWCDNLESYSDYANRLPRGRTYVRNGSVIDLQIRPGRVTALVSGTSVYEVDIAIGRTSKARWRALAGECAGKIDSVVELLEGRLSRGVMEVLARRDTGLFPAPREISLQCSCPDWATMCKHVAAVLYGVGARLDYAPEMLFVLRKVDHMDLVARAGTDGVLGEITGPAKGRILERRDLSGLFGIDLDESEPSPRAASSSRQSRSGSSTSRARRERSTVGRPSGEPPRPSRTRGSTAPAQRRPGGAASSARSRTKERERKRSSGRKPASSLAKSSKTSGARAARSSVAKPSRRKRAAAVPKTDQRARPLPRPAADGDGARPRTRSTSRTKERSRETTARELLERGVPRSTFQSWLASGVLVRTGRRGVYLTTAATERRIEKALRDQRRKRR